MGNRQSIAITVVAAAIVVAGCGSESRRTSPDTSPGPVLEATKDGLTMTVELDRWQVEPDGTVGAAVSVSNGRDTQVELGVGNCPVIQWTIRLDVPATPEGADWPGVAGEFKKYALAEGFGPGGVPALDPVVSQPRAECGDPTRREFLGAGETRKWTLEWDAEIVDGVPAVPALAPFSIATAYDPKQHGKLMIGEELAVSGRLPIVGAAPRILSAGQAIDVLLSDARFGAWLADSPRASWSNANIFLQSWPKHEGIVPAGPAWEIELFREPRNWAIAFVQPYTGELSLNFCNVPCDR